MSSVRILVTGATGYVGSRLVTALLDQGHDIVAATRNPARLADFGWHDYVNGVALDAHDEASAKNALADAGPIDVVYYLVHGIGQPDFRDADNLAAANVANAAKEAGVRRIVYLGGFVPDEDELSATPGQPCRGGACVERRRRSRRGVAGRGDDHRCRVDVV